ncbi:hypothetical protein [Streptomyces sp. NPDC088357]|uniref:hypothetical protein n=1 Tax=Streptomyces sp. NPDC088357 TaxID=3154655 RepID=UPI0034432171
MPLVSFDAVMPLWLPLTIEVLAAISHVRQQAEQRLDGTRLPRLLTVARTAPGRTVRLAGCPAQLGPPERSPVRGVPGHGHRDVTSNARDGCSALGGDAEEVGMSSVLTARVSGPVTVAAVVERVSETEFLESNLVHGRQPRRPARGQFDAGQDASPRVLRCGPEESEALRGQARHRVVPGTAGTLHFG